MKNIIFSAIIVLFLITACSNEPDVVELESGLSYVDEKVGDGPEVKEGYLVVADYAIWKILDSSDIYGNWLDDTTKKADQIGSSFDSDQSFKYVIGSGQFVEGSDEGIIGMKQGGRRMIVVPSELAYGAEGFGPVPPNTSIKILLEIIEAKEPIIVEMWDVDSSLFKETSSGLKYAIIEQGDGQQVEKGMIVTVHYSGFLEDGTKFDSSVERDEPFTLLAGMGQVIPGWDEGLQLLKEGSKARLIIPAELGYGERDLGVIPPNSTLVFDVEIIEAKTHQSGN